MMADSERVNLIEGVLDVTWTPESDRRAGRGEKCITDPRLLLMDPRDLKVYISNGIEDGSLSMFGAIWIAPVLSSGAEA